MKLLEALEKLQKEYPTARISYDEKYCSMKYFLNEFIKPSTDKDEIVILQKFVTRKDKNARINTTILIYMVDSKGEEIASRPFCEVIEKERLQELAQEFIEDHFE